MNGQPLVIEEVLRANELGIVIKAASEAMDRVAPDRRPEGTACPTCDEGIRTVAYPRRCRECTKEGL